MFNLGSHGSKTMQKSTPVMAATVVASTDAPPSNSADETTSMTRADATQAAPDGNRLRLDTSDLKSSYCNVCNASSTREEVVLSLGVNHNWEFGGAGDIAVKLMHRVILSPFAAKRLSEMLGGLMKDYEKRYGELR
jgi:PKD repeat protein